GASGRPSQCPIVSAPSRCGQGVSLTINRTIDRDADFLHNRYQARMRAAIRLLSSVCFLLPPTVAMADETAARAVIEKRCLACHGPARMSDLDLRDREAMLKGGKRGPALIPGNPDGSLLVRVVAGMAEVKMPPGKEVLSREEIDTLRDWVRDGASWTKSVAAAPAEPSWWSFRKVKRP